MLCLLWRNLLLCMQSHLGAIGSGFAVSAQLARDLSVTHALK